MSARDELEALIKKLGEAREGSRDLDEKIARTIFGPPLDEALWTPREFSQSIDVALSLVPEDEGWNLIRFDGGDGRSQAHIGEEIGDGNTPAVALCIAALRVRLAERKDEQK